MNIIAEYKGLKLISKYDQYYIRFIGGQHEEYPCDLHITTEDADMITADPSAMSNVFVGCQSRVPWTLEYYVNSYLQDYMRGTSKMSDKRIALSIAKLDRHIDIKMELYETLIYEEFPRSGGLRVCGYSAKDLHDTTYLSVLGAYNYLIYLREDETNALSDLKAGLPRK